MQHIRQNGVAFNVHFMPQTLEIYKMMTGYRHKRVAVLPFPLIRHILSELGADVTRNVRNSSSVRYYKSLPLAKRGILANLSVTDLNQAQIVEICHLYQNDVL